MSTSDVFGGASRYSQYHDAQPIEESEEEVEATPEVSAEAVGTDSPTDYDAPLPREEVESADPQTSPFIPTNGPDEEEEPEGEIPAPAAGPNRGAPRSNEKPLPHNGTAGPFAGEVITNADADVLRDATQSRSAWKAFLAKFGIHTGPSKAEIAEREAQQAADETTIRQQTWTRAVNIGVVNAKGGSGVTPGALIAGGILSDVRGGGVGVLELTLHTGSLAFRAEGRPRRGLTELLNEAPFVESAGNLAGYTAPQTSHAAVIGTVTDREQLTPGDVSKVRAVLDTYYQMTVSDLDTNLAAPTSLAAQRSMDGAIIPCTANNHSLARAVETVLHLTKSAPHLFDRTSATNPVVVVIGHAGSPEDETVAAAAAAVVRRETHGLVEVVECPYDPVFDASTEITLAHLLPATRAAWTHAVATVVAHLNDASPVQFTEGDHQS